MSVNISGRQFAQSDLVAQLEKILLDTQVKPTSIKLEITESVTMGDAERTIKAVSYTHLDVYKRQEWTRAKTW